MQSDSISIRQRNRQPCRHRSEGFTLTEIMVVIGIIVLFIALAIPAMSAISGTRSIAGAENNVSALLARAREEAIAQAEPAGPTFRGVMFFIDPATDGVVGVIVRAAGIANGLAGVPNGTLLLDTVPGRDYLTIPKGVRLRTVFDGQSVESTDRYLGFNSTGMGPGTYGGVIIFDSQGRLVVKRYGLVMSPDGGTTNSGIADLLGVPAPPPKSIFIPSVPNGSAPISQIGVVFFDKRKFLSAHDASGASFSDENSKPMGGSGAAEIDVDNWIDSNATPVLISRFTGSLVKGE